MTTTAVAHALHGFIGSDFDWCLRITAVLGPRRTMHLMYEAVKIALSPDCPMTYDATRRRDAGEIFTRMLHSSQNVQPTEHYSIFKTMLRYY